MRDFPSRQVASKRLEGICHGEDSPPCGGLSLRFKTVLRYEKNRDEAGGVGLVSFLQ